MNISKISSQNFGNIHLSKELKQYIAKYRPANIEDDINYRKKVEKLQAMLNTGNHNCAFTLGITGTVQEAIDEPEHYDNYGDDAQGYFSTLVPEKHEPPHTEAYLHLNHHHLVTVLDKNDYSPEYTTGDFPRILDCIIDAVSKIDLKSKENEILKKVKNEQKDISAKQKRKTQLAEAKKDNDKFFKSFLA